MFPKQKIPKSEKTKDWKRNCIRYFGGNRSFSKNRNAEIIRQCEIASGKYDAASYQSIENPYNLKGDQFRKYPAKLRRFDILSPMFLRIKSDYDKRPFEPVVYTKNSNFNNEKQEKLKSLVFNSLQAKFVNGLIQSGQVKNASEVEEQSPDVILNQVQSLKDIETIEGQNVLDYVIDKESYQEKYSDEFYRFFVTNTVVTFKDVRNDEVIKRTVHPANFQWTGSENLRFFEDATIVKCQWSMTFEDIVAIFQDAFIEENYPGALDDLENTWNQPSGNATDGFFGTYYRNRYGTNYQANGNITTKSILVDHIQWTSYRKVYILGYDDQMNPIVVDEDWDGNYLEERWQEECREGYIIAGKYYLGGDCVDFPVYDANDPFKVKKNYTGKIFMNDIIQQIALPDKLIQFQESYDVVKWKLQYTINKNKDKIAVIPIGLLKNTFKQDSYTDDRIGDDRIDQETGYIDGNGDTTNPNTFGSRTATAENTNNPIAEALYFADTTQMLFIDETSKDAQLAAQMIKTLDLGLGNYIEFLMNLLVSIKGECEDVIGFNRFTTGDYDNKDAVRNVQQGLKQSSAIIELFYSEFENYVQNDLQGTLDLSKYAYREGRSLTFIRNNTSIEVVNISDKFADSSKGIFIKNSRKTEEVMNMLKQESTTMLQNGMKHSVWARMISSSNNYASIIRDMENAENEMMQQQQQEAQSQQQHEQMLLQMQQEDKQKDRDLDKYKVDINAQIAIDKNIATLESFQLANPDGGENMLKLEELREKQLNRLTESEHRTADRLSNEKIEDQKVAVKKYEKQMDLKIAEKSKSAAK